MTGRHQILNDQEFWTRLEYDASRWLENSDDQGLRKFWIDGFLPETARDTKFGVEVEGTVWVGERGRVQYEYHFAASVPQKLLHRRRESFEIESLSLDEAQQLLEVVVSGRMGIAEHQKGM